MHNLYARIQFETLHFTAHVDGEIRSHLHGTLLHREPHMRQYLKTLAGRKPVVFTGDLNCGFEDLDIHNPTAKHIAKQSGLTPLERAAFAEMLAETHFRDAFRHFHPSKCMQTSTSYCCCC